MSTGVADIYERVLNANNTTVCLLHKLTKERGFDAAIKTTKARIGTE